MHPAFPIFLDIMWWNCIHEVSSTRNLKNCKRGCPIFIYIYQLTRVWMTLDILLGKRTELYILKRMVSKFFPGAQHQLIRGVYDLQSIQKRKVYRSNYSTKISYGYHCRLNAAFLLTFDMVGAFSFQHDSETASSILWEYPVTTPYAQTQITLFTWVDSTSL